MPPRAAALRCRRRPAAAVDVLVEDPVEEETTLEADGNAAVLEVQLLPKMRRQEVQPLQRKRRPSHGAAAVDHHADAAQGQEAAQIDPPPPGQSGHDCGLEADGETTPGANASGNENGSGRRQRRATGPSACSRPAVPAGIPAPTTLRSAMQWPARFIQVLPQEAAAPGLVCGEGRPLAQHALQRGRLQRVHGQ